MVVDHLKDQAGRYQTRKSGANCEGDDMLEEMDTFDGAYTTDDEASGFASVNLGRSAFR